MRWWRGLKSLLFMTCRDAAPLISQAMDRTLAAQDRAALRAHLSICPSCRRYRGQLVLLRRVLVFVHAHSLRPGVERLTPQARTRIRLELERDAGKS